MLCPVTPCPGLHHFPEVSFPRIVVLSKRHFSLHMHAKPSFGHRLQAAKMASSRISAQNNGPRAQKNGLGCKIIALG